MKKAFIIPTSNCRKQLLSHKLLFFAHCLINLIQLSIHQDKEERVYFPYCKNPKNRNMLELKKILYACWQFENFKVLDVN